MIWFDSSVDVSDGFPIKKVWMWVGGWVGGWGGGGLGEWWELYPVCFGIFLNFAKAVRGNLIVLRNAFFLEIGPPPTIS